MAGAARCSHGDYSTHVDLGARQAGHGSHIAVGHGFPVHVEGSCGPLATNYGGDRRGQGYRRVKGGTVG